MTHFTLATLRTPDGPRAAIQVESCFYWLPAGDPSSRQPTCKAILQSWDIYLPQLQRVADEIALASHAEKYAQADFLELLTPIQYPDNLFAIGANYAKDGKAKPPTNSTLAFFLRPPKSTLVGPGETVWKPNSTQQFDWECELAVIVGRQLRNATRQEAAEAIAGFSVGLDLACRDLINVDNELKVDLMRGKCQDTMAPCGPVIMPARFVNDVNALRIQMFVNGEKMIDASTGGMFAKIDEQLSTLSEFVTIKAGDILFTGSPSGSAAQHGNRWLQSGDHVHAEIEAVGTLDVTFRAA